MGHNRRTDAAEALRAGWLCPARYEYNVPPLKKLAAIASRINRTLTGQETMLGNIRRKWKQGKIKTVYLLALAVFFIGGYILRPGFAQNNRPPA